jgi:hypothetical protein
MPPGIAETPIVEDRGSAQRAIGWFWSEPALWASMPASILARNGLRPEPPPIRICVRGGGCDDVGTGFRNQARSQGGYAEGSLGGVAAALFVGAAIAASAPHPRLVMNAAKLEVIPVVGSRQGGLGVQGTW